MQTILKTRTSEFQKNQQLLVTLTKTKGARKALYTSLTNSRTRLIPQSSYPNRHGESKFGNLKIKVKNYLGILHLLKDGAGAVLSGDSGMRRV